MMARKITLTTAGWFWVSYLATIVIGIVLAAASWASPVPREAERHRGELTRSARLVWGIDAPIATFAAQVHQESGWRRDARSHVGASGLAQFMPATAAWLCGRYDDLPPGCDTTNPTWALRALVRYDRHLWDRLERAGAECDRMWATLRSYNGGLGHWLREAALAADASDRHAVDAQCGRASRSAKHCQENLGYPRMIIYRHQPRYVAVGWGRGVCG